MRDHESAVYVNEKIYAITNVKWVEINVGWCHKRRRALGGPAGSPSGPGRLFGFLGKKMLAFSFFGRLAGGG